MHQDQLKYRGYDAEGEKDSPSVSDVLHAGPDSRRDDLAEWDEERAEVNIGSTTLNLLEAYTSAPDGSGRQLRYAD